MRLEDLCQPRRIDTIKWKTPLLVPIKSISVCKIPRLSISLSDIRNIALIINLFLLFLPLKVFTHIQILFAAYPLVVNFHK